MTILISEYNTTWTEAFQQEKRLILSSVGKFVQEIEHIGSTSVLGLAAKPIIDILLGISSNELLDSCVEPLKSLGYIYISDYEAQIPFRRFFKKQAAPPEQSGVHIHAVAYGSDFWNKHILFRDLLRTSTTLKSQYEELKRKLALQFTDTNEYADAKSEFIQKALGLRSGEFLA